MVWLRRGAWFVGALVLAVLALWLGLPPLVKWQAETRLAKLLDRPVSVGAVHFVPWRLELTVDQLRVGAPATPLLEVARLRADLAFGSIWHLRPIVDALEIEAPKLRLARTAPGHYDIDDLIEKFKPQPQAQPSEPARFSLYNFKLDNGAVRFDDQPASRVHQLEALNLALPFLSNLPADVDVVVKPRLSFKLNGAAFDSGAQATPFAATDKGELHLAFSALELQPYLAYWPATLPVRLTQGTLAADLTLGFAVPAAAGTPQVALHGHFDARDIAVADPAGAPLLAWRELKLGLRDVQPLARKLAFDSLHIDGLQAHLARDAQGRLVLPAPAPDAAQPAASAASAAAGTAPAAPWQLSLDSFELADASLFWRDASTRPAAELQLAGIGVEAKQIEWPLAKPVALKLAATLKTAAGAAAGQLSGEGSADLGQAQAQLKLDGLALDALAPYTAQALAAKVDGHLSARLKADWSGDEKAPRLRLAIDEARLDGLHVHGDTPHGDKPRGASAALERLVVADSSVDLQAHRVVLGSVQLVQPAIDVARDAKGRLDVLDWLRPAEAPAAKAAPAPRAEAGPDWQVQLHGLAIERGRVGFTDAAVASAGQPMHAVLHELNAKLSDFEWAGAKPAHPATLQISARVDSGAAGGPPPGTLDWKGKLGISPLLAQGTLQVVRLPVMLFAPYFAPLLPVTLASAEAGYNGKLDLQQAGSGYAVATDGNVLLGNVRIGPPPGHPNQGDEMMGWQSLAVQSLRFAMKPGARPRLDIASATATDLYARLLVTEKGEFNLQEIGAPPPGSAATAPGSAASAAAAASAPVVAAAPAAPASAVARPAGPPLPIDITIGSTKLVNARIDFTDHFIQPHYSAALTELNGELGRFDSSSREMAPLQLSGRAEGTGLLQVSGLVNPLVKPIALDIKASATDLELAPLSPYAGKYAGYGIERGKLTMKLAYQIDATGKLVASNQVILNQLTFGDKVDSPSATKLPVRLAVALLKDSNGVIDINLPISGTLDDPQFSVGGIIVRLIVNLIVKAVTSPFALLTGGGGGGGTDQGFVAFDPGSAALGAASAAQIEKVAKALAAKTSLQMTIVGSADAAVEAPAFQQAEIESRLRAARRRELLDQGADAKAADAALGPEDHARLLAKLYAATKFPDKPAKAPAPEAMQALLAQHVKVGADAMNQLALQRATAVRDALIAQGVDSSRLFLAAPKVLAGPEADWSPRAQLELSVP